MNFTPLKIRSHYSLSLNTSKNLLLQSLNRPNDLVEACVVNKYKSFGLCDIGTVAGAISVMQACKSVCECGKQKDDHLNGKGKCRYKNGCEEYRPYKINPIIGCDFFTNNYDNISVLATNLQGWKSLMKLTSLANSTDRWDKKPILKLEDFQHSNLVCVTGQINTPLANCLFENPSLAYCCKDYDCVKGLVKQDWEQNINSLVDNYIQIFGINNLYLEVNFQDAQACPASLLVGKIMRHIAKKRNIKCLANVNCFYPFKKDATDHRLIICSAMDTTLAEVKEKGILDNQEKFFRSNNYHLPAQNEIENLYEQAEIENSFELASRCEPYNVFNKPQIPKYGEEDGNELLYKLCQIGWKEKFANKVNKSRYKEYGDRIKMELQVFKEAGLADYFLIVQDYCRYATDKLKLLMSPSRGSCGGSMVACLIGIIDENMDPVENDLFFERFYNSGRNTKDKVSLPDIDCDFPNSSRPKIIKYIAEKYGKDNVSYMATYGKLQGKGAIKEVLRVHGTSFSEMNKISANIQDPSKISGELQEKREEEGDASSIQWSLENTPKALSEWVQLENGQLVGKFAKQFEQAIRIEGVYRNQGKHASGVIISNVSLSDNLPMLHDKECGELPVAGFEMNSLEAMGFVKFDILGLNLLDKLMTIQDLLYEPIIL